MTFIFIVKCLIVSVKENKKIKVKKNIKKISTLISSIMLRKLRFIQKKVFLKKNVLQILIIDSISHEV